MLRHRLRHQSDGMVGGSTRVGFARCGEYVREAGRIRTALEREVGKLYRTRCVRCGDENARVKYFVWVKSQPCTVCGEAVNLFPNYLLAEDVRHPKNVLVCGHCGELYETDDRKNPSPCPSCHHEHTTRFAARRNHVLCRRCGADNQYCNGTVPNTGFRNRISLRPCVGPEAALQRPDVADFAKVKSPNADCAKHALSSSRKTPFPRRRLSACTDGAMRTIARCSARGSCSAPKA